MQIRLGVAGRAAGVVSLKTRPGRIGGVAVRAVVGEHVQGSHGGLCTPSQPLHHTGVREKKKS